MSPGVEVEQNTGAALGSCATIKEKLLLLQQLPQKQNFRLGSTLGQSERFLGPSTRNYSCNYVGPHPLVLRISCLSIARWDSNKTLNGAGCFADASCLGMPRLSSQEHEASPCCNHRQIYCAIMRHPLYKDRIPLRCGTGQILNQKWIQNGVRKALPCPYPYTTPLHGWTSNTPSFVRA